MGIRSIALIAGLLAVALVWVGCGDSGSGSGEVTASSISKAQFIKEADAACKKGEEEVQADFKAFAEENKDIKDPTEDQLTELVESVLVSNIKQEVDDIRALGAPSGDEEKVEAMLVAREEGVEEAEAEPKKAAQSGVPGFEKANKLAKEYGLEDCASR